MEKEYYRKLIDEGKKDVISAVRSYLEGSRMPNTIFEKMFNFFYFGDWIKSEYSDRNALIGLHPKLEKEARRRHRLIDEEKILYYRKRKDKVTFVITDYGVSWRNDSGDADWGEDYYYIPWESINRVEYNETDRDIEFYSSPSKTPFDWYGIYILTKSTNDEKGKIFADLLTDISKCFYRDRDTIYRKELENISVPIRDKLNKCELWLNDCVEFDECLDALLNKVDILLAEYEKTNNIDELDSSEALLGSIPVFEDSRFNDGNWFFDKPQWTKIRHKITKEVNEKTRDLVSERKIKIALLKGEWLDARHNIIRTLGSNSFGDKRELFKQLDKIESDKGWNSFTSIIDYQKRKLIMPLRDISGCSSQNIEVFRIDNIPNSIKFPVGHPVAGTIYIGDPFVPNMYIPYDGYEFEFFLSKVNEYCRLLQCLGATEITIKTIKGRSASDSKEQISNIDSSVGVKVFSASGEKNETQNYQNDRTASAGIEYFQRFDPNIKPFVPEGLIWYKEQSDWQSQVQQRLMGNMLEFSQRISTKETTFVSSSEVLDIKAQAEFLWSKANINYNEKSKTEFKSSEETEWIVSVKFKSLDEFDDNKTSQKPQKELPDNEEKYKEEVLFYLEDNGVITDIERRFLEKKRVRLGISEERAKEIEEECLPQLTSEEKEYIEALKELGDADLQNPRIRRMLDHEREDLGISEERALELEKQYYDQ